ncbi:hypothetical protein PMI01_03026 [Caulobacter sp. AP07]|uniref:hypothetical protein n=1 Tax=Caulobacter sp. AP07 TaxID=1144304 RepID=UPI000271EDDB|nr:hypothetical protein [Caulobacter sp. AP07]EJL30803.1 hypothetical protein PMI01_03026 [Caulobacter sp. AP07]
MGAALATPSALTAQPAVTPFENLLNTALAEPEVLEATHGDREGLQTLYEETVTKAIAPRRAPSKRAISPDAVKMIVTLEVSDRKRYEAKYQQPIWPKGQSGVTLGIGYDLGYVTAAYLREDWGKVLGATDLARLESACEVTGPAAKALLPQLASLRIGWDAAYGQFTTTTLPRFVAETIGTLPNTNLLSDDSLGALVSLVYNRGASFKKTTDRYAEMRAIKLAMVRKEFAKIPDQLISMKRLWADDPDMKGLLLRRDLEAALFKQGLKA